MKILLVDDDIYVLETIRKKIRWAELGIDEIYTALNARQAMDIIQEQIPDIMVTDIEMPGENGLWLLEWVRSMQYQIQAIFLTSYAEFHYAKKAIELSSLDYYLKPVDYEALQKGIASAAEKCRESRRVEDYKKQSEYLESHSHLIKESFWEDFIEGALEEYPLQQRLKADALPYTQDQHFVVAGFRILPVLNRNVDDYLRIYRKNLNSLAHNYFDESYYTLEHVYRRPDGHFGVILKMEEDIRNLIDVRNTALRLAECLEARENFQVYVAVGKITALDHFYVQLIQIQKLLRNVLETDNKVQIVGEEKEQQEFSYNMPDMIIWESVLESGKQEMLCALAAEYLDGLVQQKKLNSRLLKMFQLDMEQLVYRYLNKRHVEMQKLFDNHEASELCRLSLQSVRYMKQYTEYLIRKSVEYAELTKESRSVVKIIKEYLDQNYCTPVTRESLSGIVYLNADYIARLFKREMNLSINGYVIDKRIEKAKALLKKTDMPVNGVSLEVGYSNFSYFTKLFKEKTGMVPNEYRKRYFSHPRQQ